MGSKGSNTTTTNQTQTYNPAGAGYVQNALQQGQNAASLPFNIPQAPVAGFSQDQQNAFNTVNNAQGMAQPYFNQANQYFQQSAQGPNVSQFFNPYASAVTSQLNNIFGQQASQNTGQLTQAAGGVGADRIAVGQANLANQQGLAAGQTLAGLYAPSLQAAQNQQNILQSAGYGTAALGSQAQNAALSGAQAQLGTGGLQQQLSQAQLNAPYQQQLAQAAFPYQQAQFLAGITGALAPGLGGTTTGQGQTTTPAPSLWSQLLGGGTAATGLLGQTGAFGNNGWLSGNKGSGSGGSNYASQPLTGADAWQNSQLFPGYGSATAQGGAVYPYAEGGSVSDEPIDVAPQSIIPTGAQTPHIQDHIPQLNLNPPQQQSGGGGGGAGGLGTVLSIAKMFMARGGAASPYADGGATAYPGTDDNMMFASGPNEKMIRAKRDLRSGLQDKTAQPIAMGAARNQADEIMGFRPRGYADGGASFADRWSGLDGDDAGVVNQDEPFRMPGQAAMDDWRSGVDHNISAGQTASGSPDQALAFNAPDSTGVAFPPPSGSHGRSVSGAAVEPAAAPETSPYAPPAAAAQSNDGTGGFNNFIKSPWAALTAAGLGIMGGTSPYAGVNIGQGAQQGLKLLEQQRESSQKDQTIQQAAARLAQEAKFHEDAYTRETMAGKTAREQAERPYSQLTASQQVQKDFEQQKLQIEQRKPITINDPILGSRSAMYTKDGYVFTDTGQPVVGSTQGAVQPPPPSPDPSRPFMNAQPSSQTAAQAIEKGLHGQAFLDALPPQVRNAVEAVANYDAPITVFSKMKGGISQDRALELVRQMNPDYSAYYATAQGASIREFLAGGPNSPAAQIRSYNTAVGHAGEAWDALQEMKKADPGFLQAAATSGVPFASYVAAKLQNRSLLGTPLGAALNRYKGATDLYGAEVAKLYSGSVGSQEERNTIRAPLDPAKSLPEIEAGLQTSAKMMGSRGDALQDQYKTAMNAPGLSEYGTKGAIKDFPVLHDKAKAALEKMGVTSHTGAKATTESGAPVKVASPEDIRKLPKGTPYIVPDGRTGVAE